MTARSRAEQRRPADITAGRGDWQHWGTYVSDCGGPVREDYSANGNAWDYSYARMLYKYPGSATGGSLWQGDATG